MISGYGQYKMGKLGFISNYDKLPTWYAAPNKPGFGGDFFMPGAPYEGE